jgi:CubicO group peptidase (beta-lactamase class C family)/Flp pilus assembly protein TadD
VDAKIIDNLEPKELERGDNMKFKSLLCVTILSLLVFSNPIFSQSVVKTIDEYLMNMNKIGRFNGSVLVAEKDNVVLKKGYGYANVELKVPNQPDSRFDIGSISKQFTTVLVFQLIEEGWLDLEGMLTDYLPDYRADTGRQIKIDHLLQHTSGLPCYLRDYQRQPEDDFRLPFPEWKRFQRDRFIEEYLSEDLQFEPGSRFRYSNTNFFLLYVIIEKVTGKSLEQNLKEKIFDPLGMKNSGLIDDYVIIENRASGYNKTPIGYLNAKYTYDPNTYGAGSIFSTVEDIFIWNRALRSADLLPEKWMKKMFTPYMSEGQYVKHAYSVDYYRMRVQNSPEPVEYTSFNGACPGYISDAFTFPATDHTVIIFDNTEQFNHNRMASDIFKILQGMPYQMPKRSAADVVGITARKQGISSAVEMYEELKKDHIDEYEFDSTENILTDQGYLLADALRMDEAASIFGLIVELNPNSPNAYDNLGRIYNKKGESDLADDAFKKAKELRKREQGLYSLIKNGKLKEATEIVKKIQNETPSEDLFVSSQIGPLYMEAFQSGKLEEAIQICELWALGNPLDVGPYFSLARIYQKLGNTEKAIRCYEKILVISPTGRHVSTAKMRLEELKKK